MWWLILFALYGLSKGDQDRKREKELVEQRRRKALLDAHPRIWTLQDGEPPGSGGNWGSP